MDTLKCKTADGQIVHVPVDSIDGIVEITGSATTPIIAGGTTFICEDTYSNVSEASCLDITDKN